ncbi:hypothetical protein GF324_06165, partial [bacterium]|nr:hypothetical protein [bacterium]
MRQPSLRMFAVSAILSASLMMTGISHAVSPVPRTADFPPGSQAMTENTTEGRPPSNRIFDLKIFGDWLWASTGNGVGRFKPIPSSPNPAAGTWFNATTEEGLGDGGVSGLALGVTSWGDTVIFAATAVDTLINGESFSAGGGIGLSTDLGETWQWFPQPIDPVDPPDSLGIDEPTTTNVYNITYDIAIKNDRVWITSWAGGLRYLDLTQDMETLEWVNQPPDTNDFDVLTYNNHRAFSVAVMDSLLWVGTARGINLSYDDGETWQNFDFSSENDATPSGNFVTAMGAQKTSANRRLLWAATWQAENTDEFAGVSVTEDFGQSWRRVLGSKQAPVKVNNFAFDDSVVYAASDNGLFKSVDFGNSWREFPRIVDFDSLEAVYDSSFYSATVGFDRLWAGGPDGLAVSGNAGNDWRLMRSFPEPESSGQPDTYANPNPFSPSRFPVVRFAYKLDRTSRVTVEVYDFAMELVARPVDSETRPAGFRTEVWDGSGENGMDIANG